MNRITSRRDTKGWAANRLLREFRRGYPLDRLRPLLRSEDDNLVGAAVFIASELSEDCYPLLNDICPLLSHGSHSIRMGAIGCLIDAGAWEFRDGLAQVVRLLRDPHEGVRWKVLQFLIHATPHQLQLALSGLQADEDKLVAEKLTALLANSGVPTEKQVLNMLAGESNVERLFGVAGAVRSWPPSLRVRTAILSSNDSEVREAGGWWLSTKDKYPEL